MTERFIPLYESLLLKILPEEEKVIDGIVVPDTVQKQTRRAVVLDVGEGKLTAYGDCIDPSCETDDIVLIPIYGGTEVAKDTIIMVESAVIAKIREE